MKTDEIYEPIGRLVVKFQLLEFLVSALTIELMKQDWDTGFCLTSEMSFSRLVAALVAVSDVRLPDPQTRDEVRTCAGQLTFCEEGRNKIIHSMYFESGGELKRAKISAKRGRGLQKTFYDTSPKEVEDHIKRIDETNKQFMQLVRKLKAQGFVTDGFFRGATALA
jgi:hypothetical protein